MFCLFDEYMFSLDRCSITSRNIYILWSYLDIILLFSYYLSIIWLSILQVFGIFILIVIYFTPLMIFSIDAALMSQSLEVTSIQMITSKRNVGSYMISD